MDRLTVATGGLFYAWLAHDIEEYLTMPGAAHPMFARLRLGTDPDGALSRDQVDLALTFVGALFAAASVDGYRTRGRSPFYQAALYGYGVHGFMHLAGVVAGRRYTSGSATVLPVVLPFWAFAHRTLRESGVTPKAHPWTIIAFAPFGLAVHCVARRIATRRAAVAA